MPTSYPYSQVSKPNIPAIEAGIAASAMTDKAVTGCGWEEDAAELKVWMDNALSAGDETLLNAEVAAHAGDPVIITPKILVNTAVDYLVADDGTTLKMATAPAEGEFLQRIGNELKGVTPIVGTNYKRAKDTGLMTHTGSGRTTVLTFTTPTVPAGEYAVSGHFLWRRTVSPSFFIADIKIAGTVAVSFKKRPSDYGDDTLREAGSIRASGDLNTGAYTISLRIGGAGVSGQSSIYGRLLEFWRIG